MNKTYNGFFTVDYEDGDSSSYKGLVLTYGDKEKRFNNGDPLIDWYDYCKFIYQGEAKEEGIISIICSSSYDHWFMDSEDYVEKYLKLINNDYFDFMTTDELNNLSIDELNNKLKCVVHKDMKSFQELINYYKLYKNK